MDWFSEGKLPAFNNPLTSLLVPPSRGFSLLVFIFVIAELAKLASQTVSFSSVQANQLPAKSLPLGLIFRTLPDRLTQGF